MKFPQFLDYYIPILKKDFQCIENYEYNENSQKLSIPIDVFYGSEEKIELEEAKAWQKETTDEVTVTKLNGNHFFIFNHLDFFTNYFENFKKNAAI